MQNEIQPSITGVLSSSSVLTILAQRYVVLLGRQTPFEHLFFLNISCISGAVSTIILNNILYLEDYQTFGYLLVLNCGKLICFPFYFHFQGTCPHKDTVLPRLTSVNGPNSSYLEK